MRGRKGLGRSFPVRCRRVIALRQFDYDASSAGSWCCSLCGELTSGRSATVSWRHDRSGQAVPGCQASPGGYREGVEVGQVRGQAEGDHALLLPGVGAGNHGHGRDLAAVHRQVRGARRDVQKSPAVTTARCRRPSPCHTSVSPLTV